MGAHNSSTHRIQSCTTSDVRLYEGPVQAQPPRVTSRSCPDASARTKDALSA